MQREISSFFKPISKNKPGRGQPTAGDSGGSSAQNPPSRQKRKAVISSSDDDDDKVIPASPAAIKEKEPRKKARTEENPGHSSKRPALAKLKSSPKKELKKVNPLDLFGGEAKRIEAKKPPKPKEPEVVELDVDDIHSFLIEVNLDPSSSIAKRENDASEKVNKAADKSSVEKPASEKVNKAKGKPSVEKPKERKPRGIKEGKQKETNGKEQQAAKPTEAKGQKAECDKDKRPRSSDAANGSSPPAKRPKQESPAKKPAKSPAASKATPRSKQESNSLETSVLSDEERHERKRLSAILYQKYKNRSSCLNPGSKEVPKGKPDCLMGLTFLVTGVLESIERDEANSIIKEYGGRVMTVVGKKLNYLVVGEEAGPKKLAQAEELNIKVLSEDGLFDLIRERSGEKVKKDEQPKTSASEAACDSSDSKNHKPVGSKNTKPEKSPDGRGAKKLPKEEPKIKTEKKSPKLEKKSAAGKTPSKVVQPKVESKVKVELKSPKKEEPNSSKVPDDMLAWVEKYKPETLKDIIGQQGAASNVVKLTNWLSKWYTNHNGKQKPQKPNPWAKNDDGGYFKAALLSGPPGVGKTTTVTLVCKELGFDAVEFNASDTRSKSLLKDEVASLLSCKSLYGFFHGHSDRVTKKHVLIMDEVDGMAGNEDRGGMQELIALIKESSVPIICMCNDRNHPKIRSLSSYCFDLRFSKPRLEQIKGRMLSICFKEKVKIAPAKLEEIILSTNNDIRQTINHIALLSAGNDVSLKSCDKTAEKDMKIGPWEVVRKVFSAEEHKKMTLNDKAELFFHDYSMAPLFVQQNYLIVVPECPRHEVMKRVAATADALSLGDLVDKQIRSKSAWSLLPTQAFFSSVIPGNQMSGRISAPINFPAWLGKNSRANKLSRLAQELHDHTRVRTSGSRDAIRLDYASHLLARITKPLIDKGTEGIEQSIGMLREYHLLREDIDSLVELTTWRGQKGSFDAVDGRVKAALTRAYNKEGLAYSYSAQAAVKKKKQDTANEEDLLGSLDGEEGAEIESEKEDDDDPLNDGLIKAKKKPATASKGAASKATIGGKKSAGTGGRKEKASTSKAKK